jgi:hypothetical protein
MEQLTWLRLEVEIHKPYSYFGRASKMKKFITISCLLCASCVAFAGTYTAATCNYSDVNAVINGPTHVAANGDVIVIPAGTCTWTSGIAFSGIGFTIEGQGTPNTGPSTVGAGTSDTILIQDTTSSLFAASAVPYGQTMRYSLMSIAPQSGMSNEDFPIKTYGVCTPSGCPNLRMDNVTFGSGYVNIPSGAYTAVNNLFGVYDHNTFNGPGTGTGSAMAQLSFDGWLGIGHNGDESFAAPDSYGTNQAFFFENNDLEGARGVENDVGFGGLGGDREVLRFNVSNNTPGTGFFSSHGTAWTGRDRGSRQKEVYRNSINCSSAVGSCGGGGFLSGTGIVFENTFTSTGSGFFNQYFSVDSPRRWRAASVWQWAAGEAPYDEDDGTTYASGTITSGSNAGISDTSQSWATNQWAGSALTAGTPYSIYDTTQAIGCEIASNTSNSISCREDLYGPTFNAGDSYQILRAKLVLDQPGRSGGTYLSGTSGPNGGPTSAIWPSQTLDPIYELGDTHSGNFGSPVSITTASLLANRDVYYEVSTTANTSPTSPFNGTTGTGFGTLANRPTTCTAGVAYWATDQGNWNQAGGENGEMYTCTATNTWTMTYEPYVYPHPLTGGSATGQLSPPVGVTGSVTPKP